MLHPSPVSAYAKRALIASSMSLLLGPGMLRGQAPATTAIVWPAPPDQARIRYVGSVATEVDIGAHSSKLERWKLQLSGERISIDALLRPHAVYVDGAGRYWVTDMGSRRLKVFDTKTKKALHFGDDIPRPLQTPMGITGDEAGHIYLADALNHRVVVLDANTGKYLREIGGATVMVNPVDVAVDPRRNRLYVIDSFLHQLIALDLNGRVLKRVGREAGTLTGDSIQVAARRLDRAPKGHGATGSGGFAGGQSSHDADLDRGLDFGALRGNGKGEFRYPGFVTVDRRDGTVYVSDGMNFRVQVFEPQQLRWTATIGEVGDVSGNFTRPKGVAVDSQGHLYVVDAAFNNIQIFDKSGQLLLAFPEQKVASRASLQVPMGIFIDARDRIYVADKYNGQVQIFEFMK